MFSCCRIYSMAMPVKLTKDLRLIVQRDGPLSGGEALELGKRLLARGAEAVALECLGERERPTRNRRQEVDNAV